jgi:hypothetical protein
MKAPTIIVAAALVFGLAPAAQAIPVGPTETFQFIGLCQDCGPPAPQFGTATLVLQNYSGSGPISNTNYVSFTYHSILLDLSLNSANSMISTASPVSSFTSLPGFNEIAIRNLSNAFVFFSFSNGGWCAGLRDCGTDFGDTGTGTWSATPLPAALPLFATGLGALGLLGWRRRRKAQAVA